MKDKAVTTHWFEPDIMLYLAGRDKLTENVLNVCKDIVKDKRQIVSLNTKLFKELDFGFSEIIAVILKTGKILKIKFSYTLLFQQNTYFTIIEMGGQLWKYMSRISKCN